MKFLCFNLNLLKCHNTHLTCIFVVQGQIQDFKLAGAHLKKMRRAEGGANIFGIFRVKKKRFDAKKSYIFPILGGVRAGCAPAISAPVVYVGQLIVDNRVDTRNLALTSDCINMDMH